MVPGSVGDWLLAVKSSSHGEELRLFQLIRQTEYQREPYLLFETLSALAEGRVRIEDGRVLDSAGVPLTQMNSTGLCLDADIDKAMAQVMTA